MLIFSFVPERTAHFLTWIDNMALLTVRKWITDCHIIVNSKLCSLGVRLVWIPMDVYMSHDAILMLKVWYTFIFNVWMQVSQCFCISLFHQVFIYTLFSIDTNLCFGLWFTKIFLFCSQKLNLNSFTSLWHHGKNSVFYGINVGNCIAVL